MTKGIASGRSLACPKTYDSESNTLFSLKRTESSGLQARARFIGQPLKGCQQACVGATSFWRGRFAEVQFEPWLAAGNLLRDLLE